MNESGEQTKYIVRTVYSIVECMVCGVDSRVCGVDSRVYAFWPFYGRFDGSPDSVAIASTVKITSSTQGTAGAPAVDFFDGRLNVYQ